MKAKELALFIILDLAVIAFVLFLFFNIERQTAGLIAGTIFFLQGLFILHKVRAWNNYTSSFTLYGAFAHIFVATIPMVILRVTHWSLSFEDIQLGLITGPGFHKFCEYIYLGLILCHIIDLVRLKLVPKSKDKPI